MCLPLSLRDCPALVAGIEGYKERRLQAEFLAGGGIHALENEDVPMPNK